MSATGREVSDYLPRFVEAMQSRGVPQETIDRFISYWNSLPPAPHNVPCPFCFAAGRAVAVDMDRSNGTVRCRKCAGEVLLRDGI